MRSGNRRSRERCGRRWPVLIEFVVPSPFRRNPAGQVHSFESGSRMKNVGPTGVGWAGACRRAALNRIPGAADERLRRLGIGDRLKLRSSDVASRSP